VELVRVAVLDPPREREVAQAERRPASDAAAHLSAGADRQAAARLEVGAFYGPHQRFRLAHRSLLGRGRTRTSVGPVAGSVVRQLTKARSTGEPSIQFTEGSLT